MGLLVAYEVSTSDSQESVSDELGDPSASIGGTRLEFLATAYCKGSTTAAGTGVTSGVAAADPALLPLGTVVSLTTANGRHEGIYTVLDTGPAVQGRIIDLYMWSCDEALQFGRQQIGVTILRLGWDPAVSTPSLIDAEFARREAERRATSPRSAPLAPSLGPETPPDSDVDESAASTQD